MREDRVDHLVGIALLAQDRRPVLRVLVERGMDLVVEIVEERDHAPDLLVAADTGRVGRRGGLDRQGMPDQRLARRVAIQRLPGLCAGRCDSAVSIVRLVSSQSSGQCPNPS